MYEIEKNIPAPGENRTSITQFLRNLEIGDSFICERCHREKLHGLAGKARMKIKTKKVDEENIRVWRVK